MDGTIPNIGTPQRRARLVGGLLGLVGAAALLVVLLVGEAPRAARLLVALPVWAGTLGVFQAKART
ncbi:MAG: hypothetical protein P8170_04865 [Gemmatimonadota bacterium]|jgi:hypothetical protein